MSGRFVDKIALVTGATRGIGAAVARALAREGAHLILIGRTVGALEAQDDAIRGAGGKAATLVPLDLTDGAKIDELGPALYQRFGRLDCLVACAGTLGEIGPLGHHDAAKFDTVFKLNVTANFRLIRTLDPLLRAATAGRAVFAGCAAGREPTAYWGAYGASKAALECMVQSWNAEQRLTRVRAVMVDPGPVATRLRRDAFPGEDQSRLTQPDEAALVFLAHLEA